MTLEDDLRALEDRVLARGAAASYLELVQAIRQLLAAGASDAEVIAVLNKMNAPKLEAQLLAAMRVAATAGATSAASLVGAPVPSRVPIAASLIAATRALDADGRSAVRAARALAAAGADIDAAVAPVLGYANTVNRAVTVGVVGAGNGGVRQVASDAGVSTVWIAETNACVHCLAYSGRVVKSGEKFPGGLTYGAKSYFPEDVATPPRHPHCRCFLEPLRDQSYADALRREADRSVLRGFSLESESMSVRVGAAKKLLDEGVTAPKSVIAYAEAAVKRGTFSTRGR